MAKVVKHGKAVAKNAHGKPLKEYGLKAEDGSIITKLNYEFDYGVYATNQDMLDNQDGLSLDAQRKFRNAMSKTKARQAANSAALLAAGIVAPNEENSVKVRLTKAAEGYMGKLMGQRNEDGTPKWTEDEAWEKAKEKAAEFLEEEWPEEEEDE